MHGFVPSKQPLRIKTIALLYTIRNQKTLEERKFSFKEMYLIMVSGGSLSFYESENFTYSNSIHQSMGSSHVQMRQTIQATALGMLG
jgi:hypothetical protein